MLRSEMRAVRRSLPDRAERSERIWARLREIPAVVEAATIMVFASVPGEPDTAPFVEWCRAAGKTVVLPASDPSAALPDEPEQIDVVIVPGLAFTPNGERLGQGGGWYDRLLARVRPDCVTIGVGFDEQLDEKLPIEPHDVPVRWVVTPARAYSPGA